ncbi:MAG: alpha/beta hydrolase, partial [Pseudomonadota bacterium]
GCQSDSSSSVSQSNETVVITETRTKRMPLELSLLSAAMDIIGFAQPSLLNDAFLAAFGAIGYATASVKEDDTIDVDGMDMLYFAPPSSDSQRVIMYIHGGGFSSNYVNGHLLYAEYLSQTHNAHVYFPKYTNSGSVTYPTSTNNVFKAYQYVVNTLGHDPHQLMVMGDSAGGNATLSLMVRIRSEGARMPAAAATFSAWADLTSTAEAYESKRETDVSLSKERMQGYTDKYTAQTNEPLTHPEISPARADFFGFPPLLIFVSLDEILLEDSDRMFEQAKKAGIDVSYFKYSAPNGKLPHGWPIMANTGELGEDVNREVATFVNKYTRD